MRILVVEQVQRVLDQIRAILEAEGFKVIVAADAAEAISLTEADPPDLVVSEFELDGPTTGLDLLKWFRGGSKTAGIPFVLLAGRTTRDDFRKGMELGADDIVMKPFSGRDLLTSRHPHDAGRSRCGPGRRQRR